MSTAFTGPASPQRGRGSAVGKQSQWDQVAKMDEFKLLLLARKGFVVPATIFFVVYYFALAGPGRLCAGADGQKGTRPRKPRLPIRVVTILYGVGHRMAVCAGRPQV